MHLAAAPALPTIFSLLVSAVQCAGSIASKRIRAAGCAIGISGCIGLAAVVKHTINNQRPHYGTPPKNETAPIVIAPLPAVPFANVIIMDYQNFRGYLLGSSSG